MDRFPGWRRALLGAALAGTLALGAAVPALVTRATATHAQTAMAPSHHAAPAQMMSNSPTSATAAAGLRSTLNLLLQEHVYLAAAATGAALGGREAEFQAAANALDANSVALSQLIGSVYGPDAERAFLGLWRSHINMFVDYTQGAATNDQARKAKAVADLEGYRATFDNFLSSANPNLPRGAVAELLGPHIMTLAAVVDAQAAGDPNQAYMALRMAADHMHMIGDPLAEAIVRQFPEKFQ
jgi:hypothetical protein